MELWTFVMVALLLDHVLGEPRRWHPLVGFGRLVRALEARFHVDSRLRGVFAVLTLLVPAIAVAWLLSRVPLLGSTFSVLMLYAAIGLRSLADHALPVARALEVDDLEEARARVARIVGRDTASLDETGVAKAATESVLENGNDAVFAALFWFAVAGAAGVVLYRLSNTLDAMWGYRNERYERFGWAAARLDDVLNYIPARLTALTYALLGHFHNAILCWRAQGALWDSPNAGPVMAAGAGSLRVSLGGPAPYSGQWYERPLLGNGEHADATSIRRALRLVRFGSLIWILAMLLLTFLESAWAAAHA